MAAVVLGILGVRDEDIVEDYVCTSRNLDRIIERLRSSESYAAIFEQLPPETLHAEPDTMHSLLRRVREEWGSMRGFVQAAGVPDATLAGLEASLLEDD